MTSAREIVVRMSASDARTITDRIKTGVEAVWELIKQAYTERAWEALGYRSWDDYCTREFGTSRLRLPREERAEVVCSLRESGLSLRAIASATGYDEKTVRNSLAASRAENSAPAPSPAVDDGTDLATGLAEFERGEAVSSDWLVEEDEPEAVPTPKPVRGLDGKRYQPSRPSPKPSQEPTQPRRRPLTDSAREIGLDLKNITARMERLLADDRFARNKGEVAPHLRHYLTEAIKVCQDLNSQLI